MGKKYVERFNTAERVLHWFVAASFFTLLLSGLGLYSRLFHGYFDLFGGGEGAILAHKYAGVVFFISSLMLFFNHAKEMFTFDEDDRKWCRSLGGYLSKNPEHINSGKFNAGQKLFGIFMGIATLLLGVTGVINWIPAVVSAGDRPALPAGPRPPVRGVRDADGGARLPHHDREPRDARGDAVRQRPQDLGADAPPEMV